VEGAPTSPPGDDVSPDDDAVLRAKYLDYCSAQVADLLLYLSPDEMFVLAERAGRELGEAPAPSYSGMVQVATRWLSTRVALPPFDVWLEDYRAHPDRYETYLMGLWESEARLSLDRG
jgi:hypothetical protein